MPAPCVLETCEAARIIFYKAVTEKKKEELKIAAIYLTAIGSFTIGAACGGHLANYFSYRTIWISCGLLILCFLLMLIKEEDDLEAIEKKERQELKKRAGRIERRKERASKRTKRAPERTERIKRRPEDHPGNG